MNRQGTDRSAVPAAHGGLGSPSFSILGALSDHRPGGIGRAAGSEVATDAATGTNRAIRNCSLITEV